MRYHKRDFEYVSIYSGRAHCETCGKTLDYDKGSLRWRCVDRDLCGSCAGKEAGDRCCIKLERTRGENKMAKGQIMDHIDIVFDGPPGPDAGRFVEVENAAGASIKIGEWVQRPDGYWVLRIQREALQNSKR